ncbi:metallophosphoesterase [Zavarzinella formosa]|uniref:metallophosphoesterase n=1 Tax=Zavarzinella formosa TaxID=360055 RepID=UPI0002D527E8|nr:metallophosphoesterase [Zavarzinella formosa]
MEAPQPTRRKFLRRSLQVGAALTGLGGLTVSYGFWEAAHIRVQRETVSIANLPAGFEGRTIAVLADFHHGPFVGINFIREAVKLANSLKPDLFALVGDYAHRGSHTDSELPPCLEALSALQAPLGVYAIPGNHDMKNQGKIYRQMIAATPLTDLTNAARRVTVNGDSIWLAGVDEFWWGEPDLPKALDGIPDGAAIVLLSHNPDFAEENPEPRVGLVLSGHTHGGQIYLPGVRSSWIPSKYGMKYRQGLVQGPGSPVFVSRGLGEAGIPIRLNVPPEINVLTLTRAM